MALISSDLLLIYILMVGKSVACYFSPLHDYTYEGGGCPLPVDVDGCSHKGENKLLGLSSLA